MAIKTSQLYSTLWNASDALRGVKDASQYKDYVLVVLFKYISDKAQSDTDTVIEVPEGCTLDDIAHDTIVRLCDACRYVYMHPDENEDDFEKIKRVQIESDVFS